MALRAVYNFSFIKNNPVYERAVVERKKSRYNPNSNLLFETHLGLNSNATELSF